MESETSTHHTPLPLLADIDRAGVTLRALRFAAERDDRLKDAQAVADLTAAIDVLMRCRLKVQRA